MHMLDSIQCLDQCFAFKFFMWNLLCITSMSSVFLLNRNLFNCSLLLSLLHPESCLCRLWNKQTKKVNQWNVFCVAHFSFSCWNSAPQEKTIKLYKLTRAWEDFPKAANSIRNKDFLHHFSTGSFSSADPLKKKKLLLLVSVSRVFVLCSLCFHSTFPLPLDLIQTVWLMTTEAWQKNVWKRQDLPPHSLCIQNLWAFQFCGTDESLNCQMHRG